MLQPEDFDFLQKSLPFWDRLSAFQKELLSREARINRFAQGQTIHSSENECAGVLLIKNGFLRTYIISDEGREITLYRLDPGDICILSASCVLQSICFDVFVDAETDCEIIRIGSPLFSRLSSENVYVELFSYQLAAERFSDVMWTLQQILFISFDKRLASYLLEEAARSGSPLIRTTHERIARNMGSAREVVSRMLNYFSKEGLVSLSRGGIIIKDPKRLRSLIS